VEVKLIDIDLLEPSRILQGCIPKPDMKDINMARSHGINALPIVKARPGIDGHGYEILSNILTWKIAQNINAEQVPTIITDVSDEVAKINVQHDINDKKEDPIDEAKYIKALVDDGGLSVKDAGSHIGLSRTEASHRLRLLKLDVVIQELVSKNKIEIGHGKALAGLCVSDQKRLVQKILNNRPRILSIRNTELEVKKIKTGSILNSKSPDHLKLEDELTGIVGSQVVINENTDKKGHGQVVIEYQGNEVLDGILERLGYCLQSD